MSKPNIKLTAISNVFTRLMHFCKKGDIEIGHAHHYDHATLISSGSVLYEVLESKNGKTVESKIFYAPDYVFVEKNKFHRITSLEDNTVCVCIHALRTIDEDIVPSDMFIQKISTKEFEGEKIQQTIENKLHKKLKVFVNQEEKLT